MFVYYKNICVSLCRQFCHKVLSHKTSTACYDYQIIFRKSIHYILECYFNGPSGNSVGNRAQACWGWRSKPPQKK